MPRPERVYKAVIEAIAERHRLLTSGGEPFAVWEVAKETGHSRPAVRNVFMRLRMLRYLARTGAAFSGRFWRTTGRWQPYTDDVSEIIEDYAWWVAARTTSTRKDNAKTTNSRGGTSTK